MCLPFAHRGWAHAACVGAGPRDHTPSEGNRLERIENEGLRERLERLVNPELLRLLREAHERFGEKLGVGTIPFEVPETAELIEAIRRLSFLIADYARVLSARIDMDDASSIERFKKALAPLAVHRAENAPTRSAPRAEPDPDTDVIDPAEPIPPLEGPAADGPVSE